MLILALDSTALTASVALTEDETPLCVYSLHNGNTHSENLLPMVEHCLARCHRSTADVDLFAIAKGPGSFTGVRIGAATLKGLAFGTGKPCVGVSTLESLARNLLGFDGILCPVMNARRGQVYNALFRSHGDTLERLCPDRAIAVSELEEELLRMGEPVHLVGDGYDVTAENLKTLVPVPTPVLLRNQNAYSVSQAARDAYLRGEYVSDRELVPSYLRLSQAERERLEKQNPGGIKI